MAAPTHAAPAGPPTQATAAGQPVAPAAAGQVAGPAAAGVPLTVRYFAGARAAAGRADETASAGRCLDELLVELTDRHGERLAAVLQVASFLVDGVTCHDRREPLPAGATIDILPPFAGG